MPCATHWTRSRPSSVHANLRCPAVALGPLRAGPTKAGLRKETTVRYRVRALVVSALAISLAVAGCSKNTGGGGNSGGGGPQKQAAIVIDKDGSVGKAPAPDVPGAKKGGTLYWLEDGGAEHLRPQNAYVTDAQSILSVMQRTLTYYIED